MSMISTLVHDCYLIFTEIERRKDEVEIDHKELKLSHYHHHDQHHHPPSLTPYHLHRNHHSHRKYHDHHLHHHHRQNLLGITASNLTIHCDSYPISWRSHASRSQYLPRPPNGLNVSLLQGGRICSSIDWGNTK